MVTALAWSQERMNPRNGPNQDLRIAAVLRCANDAKHMIKLPIGAFGGNPQAIKKLFERAGWEVDQHNQSKCFCPTCLKGKRKLHASISVSRPVSAPTPILTEAKIVYPKDNTAPIVDVKTIPSAVKVKLRNRLDESFDDEKGVYLTGYSDERLATELDIPRSQVIAYREMAYGPLKSDPEVDAIVDGIRALKNQMADIQSDISKLELKAAACLKKLGL